MRRECLRGLLAVTAVLCAACGGNGSNSGSTATPTATRIPTVGATPTATATPATETSLTGQIELPGGGASANCEDCTNDGVDFISFGLARNAPPVMVATSQTNAQGMYDTGDLTAALANLTNASVDTNGDGKRTLIFVASVNDAGAEIGGVDSVENGVAAGKDFNTTTQVACVAAVFLTQGVDNPCVVRADCTGVENCIQTLDPDTIDDQRISRLEQAADFIAANVRLPDDIPQASCAVITCTNGGAMPATEQCVTAAFQPSM